MSAYDESVLGGQRAIDDAAHDAEPPEQPRGTWEHAAFLGALAFLAGVIVWLAVFYTSRYVSLASICLAVSLPITNLFVGTPTVLTWVSVALAALVVARHKDNITRLIRGEENRFEKKSSKKAAAAETVWLFGLHAVRDALVNPNRERLRLVVTRNAMDKLADAIEVAGIEAEMSDPRKFAAPIDPQPGCLRNQRSPFLGHHME